MPGSQRVGAAIAMGTRDDEYDYLFKGTARARSPRRARGGAWPGPARPSRLRCPGPGVAAEAFVRGAALRAAPAAPGRGGAAWGWRWGDSGGAPRAFPSRRGGGCALAAGRARSGSAGEVRAWAGAGSGAGPPRGLCPPAAPLAGVAREVAPGVELEPKELEVPWRTPAAMKVHSVYWALPGVILVLLSPWL